MFFPNESRYRKADIERYMRIRLLGKEVTTDLFRKISKAALFDCGRKLGIMKGETFVFRDMTMVDVFTDYAIFCHRVHGKSVADIYSESPIADDESEDSKLYRSGLGNTRYSIFNVLKTYADIGADLQDLIRGDSIRMIDRRVGSTARPGAYLAMRLIIFPDWAMSSGAALPVTEEYVNSLIENMDRIIGQTTMDLPTVLSGEQQAALATTIIRDCFAAGATDQIAYEDFPSQL
jgi:hypothetical protein